VPGSQGPQGAVGPQGPQGIQGVPGSGASLLAGTGIAIRPVAGQQEISSASPWVSQFTSWTTYVQYYQLGYWVASQGGEILKLDIVACGDTYLAMLRNASGVYVPAVQPWHVTVLFHTGSTGAPTVPTVNSGLTTPTAVCRGYGWGYHVSPYRPPWGGVYVVPDPLNSLRFTFYARLDAYSGKPMVTATTTAVWYPQFAGPFDALPETGWVPLMLSPVQHGKSSSASYVVVNNNTQALI
jgi:hypothetical protein